MSLVNLSHLCSHLQNVSRAHLTLTSVPSTNLHLSLLLALQKAGFLSSVHRAGPTPPSYLSPTSLPAAAPEALDPLHPDTSVVTSANIASRRLWVGLKYWRDDPVIRSMRMESKPTRRIWVGRRELEKVVKGGMGRGVKGLNVLGECLFLSTDRGVFESRECVERGVGGLALCRVC